MREWVYLCILVFLCHNIQIKGGRWQHHSPRSLKSHQSSQIWNIAAVASVALFPYKEAFAASNGQNRISQKELDEIFAEKDWNDERTSFSVGDFQRLDEVDDKVFYNAPRFVEHIDDRAVRSLERFHEDEVNRVVRSSSNSTSSSTSSSRVDVLDMCTSWTSHIPADSVGPLLGRVAGVGMNQQELERNRLLNERIIQNLNLKPTLSTFSDNTFDLVLLQLSIDYLTNPIEVMKEIGRVLRPGGRLAVSFSNRVFIDKAVAVWTGKSDLDHIDTVADYIHLSGAFRLDSLQAQDLIAAYPSRQKGVDPLYAVTALAQ